MAFEVHDGKFGGLETVRVSDPDTGSTAVIARRGATLLSWVPGDGLPDVVDGYRDEDEFRTQDGVRSGLMAPFSNRIRGARYTFDGQQHDLMPGVPESDRLTYHGFLRLLDCDVVAVDAGGSAATVRFATTAIRPGAFPGYPFAVDLEVEYTVSAGGLAVGIVGHNVGERAAPYGSGWHPYFRLGAGPVDRLELHVPARTTVRTDDALIPLDGDQARGDAPPYRTPRAIKNAVLDVAYTDLEPHPDGAVRTVLRDPGTGAALTVRQDHGLMHVFTGDTLARDRRASIALEPVELMTDAFNRPDCADAVVLAPGARREFRFGVEVTPGG
jgi:aldose 1-epimerase